ncbi:hypothetical protein ACHHYP_12517 [Achlya hypogyna]|uniref:Endonuclease/exonuclease/phosphatase domain-containing protein n=1 Tax=Achlya hypogyna TaxID=1202772 RepID=A0A1V9YGW5_ACHHY|nr:hypothetical protein ACHHYP_12517 [Achlya hypogyna]
MASTANDAAAAPSAATFAPDRPRPRSWRGGRSRGRGAGSGDRDRGGGRYHDGRRKASHPTTVDVHSDIPQYPRSYTQYCDAPSGSFRVVCFNVLADYLARDSMSHCRPHESFKFDWGFRQTRLLREMLTWQADVLCLQEVDHFHDYFEGALAEHGYVGYYQQRTGDTTFDGCAIFVKSSTFEVVEQVGIEYKVPGDPILDRDNVALALALRATADASTIVVATTHILFNPRRGDVKVAQCKMLLERLESLQAAHCPDGAGRVLLCGDFNFTPCSPLYELFASGTLDCSELQSAELSCQLNAKGSFFHERRHDDDGVVRHGGAGTAWGKYRPGHPAFRTKFVPSALYNQVVGGVVSHAFAFQSAYAQSPTDLTTGEPIATTHHERFYGTVDYIWYTAPTLTCIGVVEMPDEAQFFSRIRALPTQYVLVMRSEPSCRCCSNVSSDHLSLVADFVLSYTMDSFDAGVDLDDGHEDNNHENPHEIILDDPAETPPPLYSAIEKKPGKPSIYDFLDEVELKSVQQLELASVESASPAAACRPRSSNNCGVKLPSLAPSSVRSYASSSDSNPYYGEIKEKLDKTQTIELLKVARKKDKAKHQDKVEALEAKYKVPTSRVEKSSRTRQALLKDQERQAEQDIEKHLDFEQTLVADKSELAAKCEALTAELRKLEQRLAQDSAAFERQIKEAKDRWASSEKTRRDQWMLKKTEEIKKSTIKALEPDVQAIMAKCKENIQKAQDAANEEKRRMLLQFQNDKEEWIRREREATDKKLVEAREKERSKLMYRLDAADAELQQQLSAQRRRLQEEAEKARDDVLLEMRQLKVAHAKDLDDMRTLERQRIDVEIGQLQKDKEELARRYEADAALLREKYQADLDAMHKTISATLRSEFEMEKKRFEQEMVARRDEKIDMVIDKLQLEMQRKVEAVEKRLAQQYALDTKEYEKKLRAASDIEGAWMEKNRDLFDKCTKLESEREQLKAKFHEQASGLQHANERCARLQHILDEERGKHSQDEVHRTGQMDQLRQTHELEQRQLRSTIEELQTKIELVEQKCSQQVADLKANHDEILDKLHTRVRATIAKKDEMIETLREDAHLAQIRLTKCEAIIAEQRAQLIS